jgi:hypothetical protein
MLEFAERVVHFGRHRSEQSVCADGFLAANCVAAALTDCHML